jgi:hypothetical protein
VVEQWLAIRPDLRVGDSPDVDDVITGGNSFEYLAGQVSQGAIQKWQALCLDPWDLKVFARPAGEVRGKSVLIFAQDADAVSACFGQQLM